MIPHHDGEERSWRWDNVAIAAGQNCEVESARRRKTSLRSHTVVGDAGENFGSTKRVIRERPTLRRAWGITPLLAGPWLP